MIVHPALKTDLFRVVVILKVGLEGDDGVAALNGDLVGEKEGAKEEGRDHGENKVDGDEFVEAMKNAGSEEAAKAAESMRQRVGRVLAVAANVASRTDGGERDGQRRRAGASRSEEAGEGEDREGEGAEALVEEDEEGEGDEPSH